MSRRQADSVVGWVVGVERVHGHQRVGPCQHGLARVDLVVVRVVPVHVGPAGVAQLLFHHHQHRKQ